MTAEKLSFQEILAIVKEKLPAGRIIPQHDKTGHYYRDTWGSYPVYASVTGKTGVISEPHLKSWAARQAVLHIDQNLVALSQTLNPENHEGGKIKEDIYKQAIIAHQDRFEDAGDIGTQGHETIERYVNAWIDDNQRPRDITGFITGEDYRIHAIVRSVEQFLIDHEVRPIVSELRIVSHKFQYGGTLDMLAMMPFVTHPTDADTTERKWCATGSNPNRETCYITGEKRIWVLVLLDWKTSNQVNKPAYAMQTAAYWQGLYELTGLKPGMIIIVRLDKERMKYEPVKLENRIKAFAAFKHLSSAHDWVHAKTPRVLPLYPKETIFI